MNSDDFAAEELQEWQRALAAQHEAERECDEARKGTDPAVFVEKMNRAQALRTAADLALAEAVKRKCAYRDSHWAQLRQR